MNPVVWESFSAIEDVLPQLGTPSFFSAEATQSFWDPSYKGPTVLVFGKESTGLGDLLLKIGIYSGPPVHDLLLFASKFNGFQSSYALG